MITLVVKRREVLYMLKKIMEFLTLKWLWDRHENKG